jgi:hypothetical protein
MAHHFLQSSLGDVSQRVESLTLGRTRPAWGLVEGGRGAGRDAAAPAPKRTPSTRTESADLSSFSMSGFG